jgi:hypothetical protein
LASAKRISQQLGSIAGNHHMNNAIQDFSRHAAAEKLLADEAGPLLAKIVHEIERNHGVRVHEIRVTFDGHDGADQWHGPTCVIIR